MSAAGGKFGQRMSATGIHCGFRAWLDRRAGRGDDSGTSIAYLYTRARTFI